ncbi:uncharacterized protein LOC123224491 isoform X2 [Mangifera indica]|uniref:uncharacterized protein LOC123224491 isoform X2 n=1 Tax=Mangifera indica TaxID=29780 RepID=UPI001CFBF48C|nr:uncharacterized protein LOC123224491 isoform X2 [Mangifera indica]
MGESQMVFDVSSDEEKGFDEPEGHDYSWLSKLLCDEPDDSDEVVVVGGIKSKSTESTVCNEDDDDCVVLDADPDEPLSADNDKAGEGDGEREAEGERDGDGDGEEDDLVVVGEKGQIACRDFPHPRHLCAKCPFISTAHEKHCDQCHCYVCDSVAPCVHWGSGVCDIDHCHANEKEEFWKSLRENFRLQKDAPIPVKVPDTYRPTTFLHLNQIPPRDIIPLASDCVPHNHLSRPVIIRACSSSNELNIPNLVSQGRSRQSRVVFRKNLSQTQIVSRMSTLLRVHNNVIQRDRGLNGGNLRMFRRPGITGGASKINQSFYGSTNNTRGAHASQMTLVPVPGATSTDEIYMQVPGTSQDSFTYQNFPQTGTGSVFVSTMPFQAPVYSQTIPEPQAYSQPMSQQPIYGQSIPQLPINCQPSHGLQVSSENVPQPPEYAKHISQLNDGLLTSEFGNQRINTTCPNLSDFSQWVNVSGSNQETPNENHHFHRTGSTNEPLPFQEFNSHCNEGAKFNYSGHEFDNVWFQDNHAVQVPEAFVPAHFVDAGWAYTLSEDLF